MITITSVFWSINSSEEPVIKRGEELLKKKAYGANLDDLNLINRLFLLFNGMLLKILLTYSEICFGQLFFLQFVYDQMRIFLSFPWI